DDIQVAGTRTVGGAASPVPRRVPLVLLEPHSQNHAVLGDRAGLVRGMAMPETDAGPAPPATFRWGARRSWFPGTRACGAGSGSRSSRRPRNEGGRPA